METGELRILWISLMNFKLPTMRQLQGIDIDKGLEFTMKFEGKQFNEVVKRDPMYYDQCVSSFSDLSLKTFDQSPGYFLYNETVKIDT